MIITKNILIDLAKLCSLSYKSPSVIKNNFFLRPYNYIDDEIALYNCNTTPYFYSSNIGCQFYVFKYEDYLFFTFRGTDDYQDLLQNFNINKVKFYTNNKNDVDQIYVHEGFLKQFNSIKENIDYEIDKYYQDEEIDINKKTIIFTGHSLGGAIATLATCYFSELYDIKIYCVTFGSPRVGNKHFVKKFNSICNTSYRFVNDEDPIPNVPNAWRFSHVKGCKWLYIDKIYNELKINRAKRYLKNLFMNYSNHNCNVFNDHLIKNYITYLDKIIY